ncbi:MAG: glycosyltransferase [Anaerolineae bacterium]|nr:glycosyltransferase [Anaerolineae bacterium]
MRILHVTHQYPPDRRGGVEVYTQALAEAQARQGHTVAVLHGWADRVSTAPLHDQRLKTDDWNLSGGALASNPILSHQSSILNPRSSILFFATTPRPARHPLEAFIRSFHNPSLDRAFAAWLQDFQPDVVHIQHLKGLSARLPLVAKRLSVPVVYTLHDWWTFCGNAQLVRHTGKLCDGPFLWLNCADCAAHHNTVGSPVNPQSSVFYLQTTLALAASPVVAALFAYRERLLEASLRAADVVIAPTAFVRDRYAQQGLADDRFRVVEHGIDYPDDGRRRTEDGAEKAEGEGVTGEEIRNTHHAVRIGYLGGLSWQKGVHVLVEAFNALPPERAKLVIYGDPRPFPDYVARLRALARHPGIRFAGPYAPDDRWRILADLDLIVVPSVWPEISSLVTQEAFAAGVPVVASRVGALAGRVRDGVDGRLVPPGDVAALAAVLADRVHRPEELARVRRGGRPPRTLADHVAEIEEIYRTL